MTMKPLLILTLLSLSAPALADTLYKCTDKQSESVLFTNQKIAGRQCVVLSQTADGGSAAPRSKVAATPSPPDFPKVSSQTQKDRDTNRRTILEQELANEQRNLDEARKAGNANKAQLHERNIAALQKEMANLK